jgi:hypothetical protein
MKTFQGRHRTGPPGSLPLLLALLGLSLGTAMVTTQLVIANGSRTECWQTTYTTAILNDPSRFKSEGP